MEKEKLIFKKAPKESRAMKKNYEEENTMTRAYKRMFKPGKFYFYYEKLEGPTSIPHDLRLQLQKIMAAMYRNKKAKDIPEEFEITLRLTNHKYLIVFENKELCSKDLLFSTLKMEWLKGIDENEPGMFDDAY
jgi:hypothetical protein